MADTDSLDRPDLDTWEEIALESERHYGHPGCIECDCGPAPLREVISYARSLESQLAECTCPCGPDEYGPTVDRAVHGAIKALNDAHTEIESLRSQLAESQRENEALLNRLRFGSTWAERVRRGLEP
jgi:hypothetical protein